MFFLTIKIDFYDSLTLEKTLALCNAIIIIKVVLNKDKNLFHYNTILEKCSYK